jgi:hypothetical protein
MKISFAIIPLLGSLSRNKVSLFISVYKKINCISEYGNSFYFMEFIYQKDDFYFSTFEKF